MGNAIIKTSEKSDATLKRLQKLAILNNIEANNREQQIEFALVLIDKMLENFDELDFKNLFDLEKPTLL